MMNRKLKPTVIFLILPLLLTSCGVPGSGAPTIVEQVTHGDEAVPTSNESNPPSPSTDALTTVTNFLRAAAGEPNSRDERLNHFVSEEIAWSEPSTGIRIVRVNGEPELTGEDGLTGATVRVTGVIVGVFGQYGQVNKPTGNASYDEEFKLERPNADSRWRLVDPPRQVALDDDAFSSSYMTIPLYFPARGDASETLVPDLRWISDTVTDRSTRYSQITDWLMQGPSDWIAPTVTSAFPTGMARRSSVTVDDETVTVDVSTENVTGKADQYALMSAQLSWSLGLEETFTLNLLVDGQERLTSKVSDWSAKSRAPAANEDLTNRTRDLIYYIAEDEVRAADESAPFVGERLEGLREAAIEPRGNRMAAVVQRGSSFELMVGVEHRLEPVPDFKVGSLSDPQWLDSDSILVLADGRPKMVDISTGNSYTISATSLGDAPHSLSLAPDSRRLAYVSEGKAWVVSVTHVDDDRNPIVLGERERIGKDITAVTDVGWSQETELLVVGDVRGAQEWLWRVSVDNASQRPMDGTAGSSISKADKLAVRCNPPKRGDSVGQPVVVEIDGTILRVYGSQVQQVTARNEDGEPIEAIGHDPFVAP